MNLKKIKVKLIENEIEVSSIHLSSEDCVVKIREDLIETYDDMDEWEKQRLRLDYLDIRRCRCDKYKDALWKAVNEKNYDVQIELLSEMFIQYLEVGELEDWITYINSNEKFDRFFEIFKTEKIRFINSVHAVVLAVVSERYDND